MSIRNDLRSLHSITWELELLLSGALTFALIQAPGPLDRAWARLDPFLADSIAPNAFLLYYYLKVILLTLIAAFGVHLATRTFWVAMVGLDSVFPGGVKWGKLEKGVISKAFYRARMPSVKRLVQVADSVSSVIFSGALAIVALFAGSLLLVAFAAALRVLLLGPLLGPELAGPAFWILLGALVVPPGLAQAVDRFAGSRLDPDGLPARLVRGGLAMGYWLLLMPLFLPVSLTLSTRLDSRLVTAVSTLAFTGVVGVFAVQTFAQRGVFVASSSPYIPPLEGPGTLDPVHYESLWEEMPFVAVPSVEAPVASDPYLRLFLPYDASRDDEAVREVCPDDPAVVEPGLRRSGSRAQPPPAPEMERLLSCVLSLWEVTLDGDPVVLDAVFTRHEITGWPGLMAFLPLRRLSPGRHLITAERRDVTEAEEERGADDGPRRWALPFWR
jgi:hypothetical protein